MNWILKDYLGITYMAQELPRKTPNRDLDLSYGIPKGYLGENTLWVNHF